MATAEERLLLRLEAQLTQFQREMNRANGIADRAARNIERRFATMNTRLNSIGRNAARSLTAPLVGIGAALSVSQIAGYADAWTRAGNALRVAGIPASEMQATLERLFNIAQGAGASLEPTVALFGKLAQSAVELGASQEQLFAFSKGVGDALKVAGATATSASGALQQLSQALGGAIVRAEEFNSINEGARPILQAVAVGLDEAGGSVSRLRALVIDGQVTSQAFFQAFLRGSEGLAAQAATATTTIEQGLTKVSNAFTKYIGETDEGLSASQRLTQALSSLADNFDTVADTALQVAGIIAGALLGKAIGGMIAQVPLAISAVGGLITAMRAGTGVALAFRAALGPIGLVLGAVATALTLLGGAHHDAAAAALVHQAAIDALTPRIDGAIGASADYTNQLVAQAQASLDAAEASLALAEAQAAANAEIRRTRETDTVFGVPLPIGPGDKGDREDAAVREARRQVEQLRSLLGQARGAAIRGRFDDAFNVATPAAPAAGSPAGGDGGGGGAIAALADDYAALAPEIDLAADAQAAFNDRMAETQAVASDALKGFIDDLIQGKSAAEALGGVLQKLGSKLIDSGINALVGGIFGGPGAGVGGLFSGIFGGSRAVGGPVDSGKAYKVHKDEWIVPRTPGTVVPVSRTGQSQQVSGAVAVRIMLDGKMLQGEIIRTSGPVAAQVSQKVMSDAQESQRRGLR